MGIQTSIGLKVANAGQDEDGDLHGEDGCDDNLGVVPGSAHTKRIQLNSYGKELTVKGF